MNTRMIQKTINGHVRLATVKTNGYNTYEVISAETGMSVFGPGGYPEGVVAANKLLEDEG